MQSKTYESFPPPIVLLSVAVSVAIYVLGVYILAGLGLVFAILYAAYCLWVEFRILRGSCVNCYYYGKLCGLGRGKLCPLIFRRSDPQKFVTAEISWWDVAPDFMVAIFPLVGGIILLAQEFAWSLLVLLLVLAVLFFAGSAVIRGSFACKYCKQKELGCPAQELFGQSKQ